jgi:hypothetical protein
MKNCTKCKQVKPLSDYYNNGTGKGKRPECKKCCLADTRMRRKRDLDGYWRVYKLPSENYVGITSDIRRRVNSHRSGKQTAAKNVDDIKILAKYKRVEWAIIHEAVYHLLGYDGCHLTPNKKRIYGNKYNTTRNR